MMQTEIVDYGGSWTWHVFNEFGMVAFQSERDFPSESECRLDMRAKGIDPDAALVKHAGT
jgi:hypothetical protein